MILRGIIVHMFTLYLFRHEKTEKSAPSDILRKLTEEGIKRASKTAALLKEKECLPEAVLISEALRAVETFDIFKKYSGCRGTASVLRELYPAGAEEIMKIIAARGKENKSLMIIAHNPALEILTKMIAGVEISIKAGEVVVLSMDIDSWSDSLKNKGKIRDIIRGE